ncbi:MAG: hypothetical protein WC460_02775 [Patescibacteria group bacterium]
MAKLKFDVYRATFHMIINPLRSFYKECLSVSKVEFKEDKACFTVSGTLPDIEAVQQHLKREGLPTGELIEN